MSIFLVVTLTVNFLLRGLVFCEDMGNWKANLPVPKFILNGPPEIRKPSLLIERRGFLHCSRDLVGADRLPACSGLGYA